MLKAIPGVATAALQGGSQERLIEPPVYEQRAPFTTRPHTLAQASEKGIRQHFSLPRSDVVCPIPTS